LTWQRSVNQALAAGGLSYKPGSVRVRHLLDVIMEDVGCEGISAQVTRPLKGLRVAPYYGCLISRPGLRVDEHNPEYPMILDELLTCLGAQVVDFPLKTHCCGGHMTQISEATGFELIRRLVKARPTTRRTSSSLSARCASSTWMRSRER
jgi:heterodisulfide reductase subunit B2